MTASMCAAATRAPVEVTLLYTSDEHGWILPTVENGTVRGGAAETLGQLKAREGHCVGDRAECPDARTILLSGGDNFTDNFAWVLHESPPSEPLVGFDVLGSGVGNDVVWQ